jgi:nucleoid-associated protein YgaU
VEDAVKNKNGDDAQTPAPTKTDAKTIRALRAEATAIAGGESATKSGTEVPSTDAVLKKVQNHLQTSSETTTAAAAENKSEVSTKFSKAAFAGVSPFKRKEKKEPTEPRTYVVQPGDSLFRVAEKFYGDSTQWKKIRDANRTRIDPDGRIRAGQVLVVP